MTVTIYILSGVAIIALSILANVQQNMLKAREAEIEDILFKLNWERARARTGEVILRSLEKTAGDPPDDPLTLDTSDPRNGAGTIN